jgi:hypothetical protein
MKGIKLFAVGAVLAVIPLMAQAGNFHPLKKKIRLQLPEYIETECEAVDFYMSKIGYKRHFKTKFDKIDGFCKNSPKYRYSRKAQPLYMVLNAITNKKYNFIIDDQKKLYLIEERKGSDHE